MPTIIVQQSILPTTGIPSDVMTNTLYFTKPSGFLAADYTNITDALENFWDTNGSLGFSLRNYTSDLAGNTLRVKGYLEADPKPRNPVFDNTRTLVSPTSGDSFPTEVACCLSFQGARISGQAQARRRGRIYIGFLALNSATQFNNQVRPGSEFTTALLDAGERLYDEVTADGLTWVVYSPTTPSVTPITNLWVDNAFDTQRRRGLDPTTRTTRTL